MDKITGHDVLCVIGGSLVFNCCYWKKPGASEFHARIVPLSPPCRLAAHMATQLSSVSFADVVNMQQ